MFPKYPFAGRLAQQSRAYISRSILALLYLIWDLVSNYLELSDSLKEDIMDRCDTVQDSVNAILSTPRQIAYKLNENTVKWINRSVKMVMRSLTVGIDLIGRVLVFVFNSIYSVAHCLVESVVGAGLDLLEGFTKDIMNFAQGTVDVGIKIANWFSDAAEAVANFFSPTKVDVPNVEPYKIPSTIPDALRKINEEFSSKMPEAKVEEWLMKPFNLAVEAIEAQGNDLMLPANTSLIPASSIRVFTVQLCDRDGNSIFGQQLGFVDEISSIMHQICLACIGLASLTVVVVIVMRLFFIRRVTSKHEARLAKVNELIETQPHLLTPQSFRIIQHELQYPTTTKLSKWAAGADKSITLYEEPKSTEDRSQVERVWRRRWFADYVLHGPSIVLLATGVAGLLFCFIQLQAISNIRSSIVPQVKGQINTRSTQMVQYSNRKIAQNAQEFINNTNSALEYHENQVNSRVFEPMENVFIAVNGTLNHVLDDVGNFFKGTLGLSIFGSLIDRLFSCLARFRARSFAQFMDLINSLKLRLPRIDEEMFQINEALVQDKIDAFNVEMFGDGEQSSGKLGMILAKVETRIRRQMIFYGIAAGLGIMVIVQGLVAYLYFKKKSKQEAMKRENSLKLPMIMATSL